MSTVARQPDSRARNLVRRALRRWPWIVATWAILALLAASLIASSVTAPRYEAAALLEVKLRPGLGDPPARTTIAAHLQRITSPRVLGAAALDPGLAREFEEPKEPIDPGPWFRERLRVEPVQQTSLIRLAAWAPDPATAAATVDAVAKAYTKAANVSAADQTNLRTIQLNWLAKAIKAQQEKYRNDLAQLKAEATRAESAADDGLASLDRYRTLRGELNALSLDRLARDFEITTLSNREVDRAQIQDAIGRRDQLDARSKGLVAQLDSLLLDARSRSSSLAGRFVESDIANADAALEQIHHDLRQVEIERSSGVGRVEVVTWAKPSNGRVADPRPALIAVAAVALLAAVTGLHLAAESARGDRGVDD
jgi:uncharacterized protein involved in exopolysaccharide biosynthesis